MPEVKRRPAVRVVASAMRASHSTSRPGVASTGFAADAGLEVMVMARGPYSGLGSPASFAIAQSSMWSVPARASAAAAFAPLPARYRDFGLSSMSALRDRLCEDERGIGVRGGLHDERPDRGDLSLVQAVAVGAQRRLELVDLGERLAEDRGLRPSGLDEAHGDLPLPQLEPQGVAQRLHPELRRAVGAVNRQDEQSSDRPDVDDAPAARDGSAGGTPASRRRARRG